VIGQGGEAASAAGLDTIANHYQADILDALLPHIEKKLRDPDWRVRAPPRPDHPSAPPACSAPTALAMAQLATAQPAMAQQPPPRPMLSRRRRRSGSRGHAG
jgi:hypothetical protein